MAFARRLAVTAGPVVVRADANTPKIDGFDISETRTHWRSGRHGLMGEPGDDVMWGPVVEHRLMDVLRTWLSERPEELDAIRRERPGGPLAVSHHTGRRKGSPGRPRRYDSIWATTEFRVMAVSYRFDSEVQTVSDHASPWRIWRGVSRGRVLANRHWRARGISLNPLPHSGHGRVTPRLRDTAVVVPTAPEALDAA